MKILKFAPVLALLGAMALSGCGPQETPPAPGAVGGKAPAGSGKVFTIGLSQCNLGEPWRVQMNNDIKAEAEKHKSEINLVALDAQNKSETQQGQVRELIQRKVDLIIISPKESRPLTRPVEEAMDAGIPVIVLDRKVDGDKYTCFIGGDNVKIGREAGKYMVQLLGGKGDIVELKGLMTSQPAIDRHNGFVEGIKGSNIKVVFDVDCKWLEPDATREMSSALSTHPKIDAVYGHNDPSAHGAYTAARTEGKGREKQIKFIGIDGLPNEGQRYVKDGILSATFQYPTGGKEAIENALKILKGEKVEKIQTLGTRIFTPDTLSQGGKEL